MGHVHRRRFKVDDRGRRREGGIYLVHAENELVDWVARKAELVRIPLLAAGGEVNFVAWEEGGEGRKDEGMDGGKEEKERNVIRYLFFPPFLPPSLSPCSPPVSSGVMLPFEKGFCPHSGFTCQPIGKE